MKTVAIIGASNDRGKFGNKAVRAFQQQGYTVYPVNPGETEIEGLPAYKSILDVPVRPDMASVYLPPPTLLNRPLNPRKLPRRLRLRPINRR